MLKNKFFLFFYASTTRTFIELVGRLTLAELIALFSLPFIKIGQLFKQYKGLRIVLGSLFVLLLAQMFSDLVNQSAPSDYLRGWGIIVFAMVSTIYLLKFLSVKPDNIIYYFLGIILIQLFDREGDLDLSIQEVNTNYFKYRFVGFLNPAVLITGFYLFKNNKQRSAALLFFAYGLICMGFDARSNGFIFIVSAILLYTKAAQIRLSRKKIVFGVLVLSGFFYLGYAFYVNQVMHHGYGGNSARTQLNMASNPYNPFELLYYGRAEFVVLFQAGLDKPIFGFGSWGKDPGGHYAKLIATNTDSYRVSDVGYIKAHSILLGFWAYAGILGLFSVVFLFWNLFSYSLKMYKSNYQISVLPILLIFSVDMLWAFFFSPIGYMRTGFPIFASLVIIEYTRYQYYISNNQSNGLT